MSSGDLEHRLDVARRELEHLVILRTGGLTEFEEERYHDLCALEAQLLAQLMATPTTIVLARGRVDVTRPDPRAGDRHATTC